MIGDKKAKQVCDTDTSIEHVSQPKDTDSRLNPEISSIEIEIEKAKEDMI